MRSLNCVPVLASLSPEENEKSSSWRSFFEFVQAVDEKEHGRRGGLLAGAARLLLGGDFVHHVRDVVAARDLGFMRERGGDALDASVDQ